MVWINSGLMMCFTSFVDTVDDLKKRNLCGCSFSYCDCKTAVDVQVGGRSVCYTLVHSEYQWIWWFHGQVFRITETKETMCCLETNPLWYRLKIFELWLGKPSAFPIFTFLLCGEVRCKFSLCSFGSCSDFFFYNHLGAVDLSSGNLEN